MGRSLLVEEVTTTWCPTCAQIDPYLKGVADSHGSRIAMVAYHPSDGEDAFQPPAAQHRINRLGLHHGNAIPSPTFFVEGKNPRSGTEAWSDVQRDILDLELTRQDSTLLQFEVLRTAEGITARVLSIANMSAELENTQLTFLVLEHEKTVQAGVVNQPVTVSWWQRQNVTSTPRLLPLKSVSWTWMSLKDATLILKLRLKT